MITQIVVVIAGKKMRYIMNKKELVTNAVGIAEGWIEAKNEQEIIDAWQYLHNTGLAYDLQGWFGRTARDLINEGIINE